MIGAWKLKNQVEVQDLRKNLFLFKFTTERFEEMDPREFCHTGRFMRIKVTMNLQNPLKRGTVIKFKEKDKRVHFKYERFPTFCFVCGRIGHQLKDCDSLEDLTEEVFEELDEQDLSYGQWLRASPFPKMTEDQLKKELSSRTYNKSLFQSSTNYIKCGSKGKEVAGDIEVQQVIGTEEITILENGQEKVANGKNLDIEVVAESFGVVAISKTFAHGPNAPSSSTNQKRKWVRKKGVKKTGSIQEKEKAIESTKR